MRIKCLITAILAVFCVQLGFSQESSNLKLLITEYFVAGTGESDIRMIELYNYSDEDIDFSVTPLRVRMIKNRAGCDASETVLIQQESGVLPSQDVLVLGNDPSATRVMGSNANLPTYVHGQVRYLKFTANNGNMFTGDDVIKVYLRREGLATYELQDVFGKCNDIPRINYLDFFNSAIYGWGNYYGALTDSPSSYGHHLHLKDNFISPPTPQLDSEEWNISRFKYLSGSNVIDNWFEQYEDTRDQNTGTAACNNLPDIPNGTIIRRGVNNESVCNNELVYTHGTGQGNQGNSIQYYWQTTSNGTSLTHPVTSPYNIGQVDNVTVYVRARRANGCWSSDSKRLPSNFTNSVSQNVSTSAYQSFTHSESSISVTLRGNVTSVGRCPNTDTSGFVISNKAVNALPTINGNGVNNVIVNSNNINNGYYTSVYSSIQEGVTYIYRAYVSGLKGSVREIVYGDPVEIPASFFNKTLNPPRDSSVCIYDDAVDLSWQAPVDTSNVNGYVVVGIIGSDTTVFSSIKSGYNSTSIHDSNDFNNPNLNFSNANNTLSLNSNIKLLHKGTATNVRITGLTEGQNYYFRIYSYKEVNGKIRFSSPINRSILAQGDVALFELSGSISDDVLNNNPATYRATLRWTLPSAVCNDVVLVVANKGEVVFNPVGSPNNYTPNTDGIYNNLIGNTQILYKGSASTAVFKGLQQTLENEQYCFKIFTYRGNYKWSNGKDYCIEIDRNYCTPIQSSSPSSISRITNVSFNTINNSSIISSSSTYQFYKDIITTVYRGVNYSLDVKVTTNINQETSVLGFYDWNLNGTFALDETYNLGTVKGVNNNSPENSPLTISVPVNAKLGYGRMRIKSVETGEIGACDEILNGEVEDYRIKIETSPNPVMVVKGNNRIIPNGFMNSESLNHTIFSSAIANSGNATRSYNISNVGLQNLNYSITIEGENPQDFQIISNASGSVAFDANINFTVRFTPTFSGDRSAIVKIASNDVNGDVYTFKVKGEGLCSSNTGVVSYPNSGPVGTIVTFERINTSVNLSTYKVNYNGQELPIISRTATHIKVAIPENAKSGNFILLPSSGCYASINFTVDSILNTACASERPVTTDLVFSEIFDKNDGSFGAISIYNGTANTINLSGYSIYRSVTPGGNFSTYKKYVDNLSGNIQPGKTIIITTTNTQSSDCTRNNNNGSLINGFNDSDSFRLYKTTSPTASSPVIDEVNTPNHVGFYLSRKPEYFVQSPVFNSIYWNEEDTTDGQCKTMGVIPEYKKEPIVITNPIVYEYCNTAKLSVVATEGISGNPGLNYQWYRYDGTQTGTWQLVTNETVNGTTYSGATTNELIINGLANVTNYQYYVKVRENTDECYAVSKASIINKATIWNGNSWSDGVPNENMIAIFDGDYAGNSIEACQVLVKSGVIVFNEGKSLITNESVNVDAGSLRIKNNASLIQKNNNAINSGDIIYERITSPLDAFSYTYWGAPIEGSLSDILWFKESSPNNFNVPTSISPSNFKWNSTTQGWAYHLATDPFIPGHGLIIKAPNDFPAIHTTRIKIKAEYKGVPNNGIYTINIPADTNIQDSNHINFLLSNPYPSSIDIKDFLLKNIVNNTMFLSTYLWKNQLGLVQNQQGIYSYQNDYAIASLMGGIDICQGCSELDISDACLNGTSDDCPKIASGQGFFVRSYNGGNVIFDNSLRYKSGSSAYDNSKFYRVNENSYNQEELSLSNFERHRFWINLKNQTDGFAQTLIGYSNYASNDLDVLDSSLISSAPIKVYSTIGSQKLAIQSFATPLDQTQVIPLTYEVNQAGTYTFELDQIDNMFIDQDIFLKDNLSEVIHDLKSGSYSFISEPGVNNNRFEIVFLNQTMSTENNLLDSSWIIYSQNDLNIIKTMNFEIKDVFVYDLLGREVYSKKGVNSSELSFLKSSSNQVFIVKIITTDNQMSIKKFQN